MSEFPFGDLLVDGTRNGVYKPKSFHGSGAKIVNMGELFAHPRLRSVPMKRLQLSTKELERSSLAPGDLLFARRSLVAEGAGKCSIVLEVSEPTTFESSIIRARPDPTKADSLFLYYFFNSPIGMYLLGTIRRQVAVAGITGSDLVQLPVSLPDLEVQRQVSRTLGAFDDKIELNQQMNETLEAMARAIFKSWFVDFDPVRAKAEGRQPQGIPAHIADLFPNSFQDSPLGPIPKGWRAGTIGEVAENHRRTARVGEMDEASHYIGLEHMPRGSIALADWGGAEGLGSNKFKFKRGEILFGKLRPYFHKVGIAPVDGVCSTDVLVLSATPDEWRGFLLGHVSSEALIAHVTASSSGTRMPRTNWKDIAGYDVVLPEEAVAQAYDDLISPMLDLIQSNIRESKTLAKTRDTLLPKLLSGEVQVA